ncbi:MAG TPA: MBL fold metallo-hydrolase [Streptomyces sp.]|nr:MBL fold metallo-hydrolase [Streptomyces sp.]
MPVAPHPATDGLHAPAWNVGDLAVRRIDEIPLPPQTGPWLLPRATPEIVARTSWLRPDFADQGHLLRLASHSFAVEVGGLRVLIDTGIGNGKPRANPAWNNLNTDYLQRLTEAGFAPETVDLVVLTHLHTDHVGWNTTAVGDEWAPTFPNARHLTARTEWDHWSGVDLDAARRQMFQDSVHPVKDAGLLDLVDVPHEGITITPGLRLLPTPGHTPGHIAVELHSRGESALVTGDCIHHPVQLAHPDMGSCVDTDPAAAARTRRQLLNSLSGSRTLLLGSHFPPPTAGHVISQGDSYELVPAAPRTATTSD